MPPTTDEPDSNPGPDTVELLDDLISQAEQYLADLRARRAKIQP